MQSFLTGNKTFVGIITPIHEIKRLWAVWLVRVNVWEYFLPQKIAPIRAGIESNQLVTLWNKFQIGVG